VHGAKVRRDRSGQQEQIARFASVSPDATRGRDRIMVLIAARKLELVEPDSRLATMQLASEQAEMRPEASLTLAYDAARKAVVAMLEAQGLRARMPNAHANVQEALGAQWGGALADRFGAARRARHRAEYPSASTTRATSASAARTVALAEELCQLAEGQIRSLPPFPR